MSNTFKAIIKLFYFGCIPLLLLCSCSSVAQEAPEIEITRIQYKSYTRGASVDISVTRDSLIYYRKLLAEKDSLLTGINQQSWNNLVNEINRQGAATFPLLEPPSDKRMTDADWHAQLSVFAKDTSWSTPYFDKSEPMEEVKPVLDILGGLIEEELY